MPQHFRQINLQLDVQASHEDKYHSITAAGLEAHQAALTRILPDAQLIFAEWSPEEIDRLHQSLFRLQNWLDDHRDTVADNNNEA